MSVKSSQELYECHVTLEMDEIIANREGELKEIALIFMAKGIPQTQALEMAREAMANKDLSIAG